MKTVHKYRGLQLPAPVHSLRVVTVYAGDLASVIARSTYRPFMRKCKRGTALEAWLHDFAVRRRHRIVALVMAGHRPATAMAIVNRLNCRPAGACIAGPLWECHWHHCPFCYARTVARLWAELADWMFEPDPLNHPDCARGIDRTGYNPDFTMGMSMRVLWSSQGVPKTIAAEPCVGR